MKSTSPSSFAPVILRLLCRRRSSPLRGHSCERRTAVYYYRTYSRRQKQNRAPWRSKSCCEKRSAKMRLMSASGFAFFHREPPCGTLPSYTPSYRESGRKRRENLLLMPERGPGAAAGQPPAARPASPVQPCSQPYQAPELAGWPLAAWQPGRRRIVFLKGNLLPKPQVRAPPARVARGRFFFRAAP